MQILLKYDKTYTLNIDSNISVKNLTEKIFDKVGLPQNKQILIYNGKVINGRQDLKDLNIKSGDCINISLKLFGGNFISTGNLIILILISLALYFTSYPIIFYFLELLLSNSDTNLPSSQQQLNNVSSNFQNVMDWLERTFRDSNILSYVVDKSNRTLSSILPENTSPLLFLYLGWTMVTWFLYSATITMIFYSYFKCQQNKPSKETLVKLVIMSLLYIASYGLIYWLGNWNRYPRLQNFFQNYSVLTYILVTIVFLFSYYTYTLKNYDFSLIYYIFLTTFVLFFYFFLIIIGNTSNNKLNYYLLFLILPLLGSVFYVVAYLKDYFNTFSENC